MVRVVVVIREIGRTKPDYSLTFDLPEVPAVGSYLSIQRPDKPAPYGEDVVVRHAWWRLNHPETSGFAPSGADKIGGFNEIMLECDPAISPYSSDQWRRTLEAAQARGVEVPTFDVARFAVSEAEVTERPR